MLKLIFIFIALALLVLVRSQANWDPNNNGDESTYMAWTWQWKKEIVALAKDSVFEIKNSIHQVDQISWTAADDLRFQIGQTIGRIMELHRQQVDMYRRMKRRFENRFNWLRPEISAKLPQLPHVEGSIEPVSGQPPSGDFGYPWLQNRPNMNDYKPQTYVVALEFITKREIEIEHLVKLLTNFVGEEEVSRFRPNLLPADQSGPTIWAGYSTEKLVTYYYDGRRQVSEAEKREREEKEFKAKMRANYYKKRASNNK